MQEQQTTMNKNWLAVLFIGQLLLSLSDFYFSGLGFPIVPVFGSLLFVSATLALPRPQQPENVRKKHRTLLIGLLLAILFFFSSFWGLAAFKTATMKGPAGISFGILLFCIATLQDDNPEYKDRLYRNLNTILWIHFIAWLLQFLGWMMFHTFLDYLQPITGTPTRHGVSLEELVTKITRFTGLFAEPANYVTFMFEGLAVRMIRSDWKLKRFDALLIISMIASFAITGFILVMICLMLWLKTLLRTPRAWAILGAVLVGLIIFGISQSNTLYMRMIILRLQNPSSDSSVRIRTENALNNYSGLPESAQIFGAGFGNYQLSENVSNGVLNLLIFLGVLGAPLYSGVFIWLLRQRRFPGTVWLFLSATLPFAPPFTMQNWWMWIGLMVLFGQDKIREREAIRAHNDPSRQGAEQLSSGALMPPTMMG